MVMIKVWSAVKEAMVSIEVFAISENNLCIQPRMDTNGHE